MGVYSSYSLKESSNVGRTSGSDHVLDLMVENTQNDMKLFESVIELDFMQAYNEAGVISINEEETQEKAKVSIGQKIKDLFTKLMNTIKSFINDFIAKIRNLLANDEKLAKSYMKNFDDNAVGYKVKDFIPMYNLGIAQSNFKKMLDDLSEYFDNAYRAITTAKDTDAINNATDKLKEDFKKAIPNVDNVFFSNGYSKIEDYTLTAKDVAAIKSVMMRGGKGVLDSIKAIGNEVQKDIKAKQSQATADKYVGKVNDSSLAVAKANARYKCCSQYASTITRYTNAICGSASRYIAAARRAFIAAGKGASAQEVTNSSAISMDVYDAILSEASDIYVESALAMV